MRRSCQRRIITAATTRAVLHSCAALWPDKGFQVPIEQVRPQIMPANNPVSKLTTPDTVREWHICDAEMLS